MKTRKALGVPRAAVLLLLAGLAVGAVAWAQQTLPAPGGSATGPTVLSEGSCCLVSIPLREPLSRRMAPAQNAPGADTSINWGGYAVATRLASPQAGAVTSAQGSWIIPRVKFSGSAYTYSAMWVGMDGSTVEQIGTEQDWTPRGQVNYVWFEMYPRSAYAITGFPIVVGDRFGAGVTYIGNSTFVLGITNFTRNTAYVVPTRYTRMPNAQRSSAEWIVEAPYSTGLLPLANFGTAYFLRCTARLNGTQGPIDDAFWQAEAITMETLNGFPKARPSALRDAGTGHAATSNFSVTWSHE